MEFAIDQSEGASGGEHLPEPLPADPMPLCRRWFDEAHERKVQRNPNVMTLATLDPPPPHPHGRLSARMVLCKEMDVARGCLVFFTNYTGRKAVALEANPLAAAVFHWDALDRQMRFEGRVTRVSEAESDAYFATRPWESQIGAWASEQSRPIESREAMRDRVAEVVLKFGIPMEGSSQRIPRPPHWGGYRVWADYVELWVAGEGRVHDRAAWKRELKPSGGEFERGSWSGTRLQP